MKLENFFVDALVRDKIRWVGMVRVGKVFVVMLYFSLICLYAYIKIIETIITSNGFGAGLRKTALLFISNLYKCTENNGYFRTGTFLT